MSRASGVPVATIKYYLREGLVPRGERTAVNQASYGEHHLHRLQLIRVLREVAALPVATIKKVVEAINDDSLPVHALLGIAHHALGPHYPSGDDEAFRRARRDVDGFLHHLGWQVSAQAPARTALAHTLASLRRLGYDVQPTDFTEYARAADRIASWELEQTVPAPTRQDLVEQVVVGTLLYEKVLVALRRLAQERHSALRFRGEPTVRHLTDNGHITP